MKAIRKDSQTHYDILKKTELLEELFFKYIDFERIMYDVVYWDLCCPGRGYWNNRYSGH